MISHIKIFLFVGALLFPAFIGVIHADEEDDGSAQSIICRNVDDPGCEEAGEGTVTEITGLVLNVLSIIIGVGSVLVIIIAGFRQVVSAGNPDAVKKSKDAIIYALVGVVVAIFAQVIVQFVLSSV